MGLIFIQAPPSPRGVVTTGTMGTSGWYFPTGWNTRNEASETLALMASGRQADILQRMIPALFHGNQKLGGGFKYFSFSLLLGEDFQFD